MNRQRLLFISLLIAGLITAGVVAVLIVPTMNQIRTLASIIRRERVSIETQYFHRQKVRKTIENLEEIKMRLPDLRALALQRGSEESLIEKIEAVADLNGVKERLRLIEPTGGATGYGRKLAVELTVNGDALGFGKFLSDLERMDILLVVTNLTVVRGERPGTITGTVSGWVSWPDPLPIL